MPMLSFMSKSFLSFSLTRRYTIGIFLIHDTPFVNSGGRATTGGGEGRRGKRVHVEGRGEGKGDKGEWMWKDDGRRGEKGMLGRGRGKRRNTVKREEYDNVER